MADFEVTGAEDFLKLSKACKEAGEKGVRTELHKGMQDAVKPLLPGAAERLAAGLPPKLQGRGRRVKQVVQVKTGTDPGVTVAVRYGRRGSGGLGASNAQLANRQGLIRHPLFGKRTGPHTWFSTKVPRTRGWFDDYYTEHARDVLPAVEKSMQRVIDKIVTEAKR